MSTTNTGTLTFPVALVLWRSDMSEVSKTIRRVHHVKATAEDRAVVVLDTGITLLVEVHDDAETEDDKLVRVTIREDGHDVVLRDGSLDSVLFDDDWRGYVYAAIKRYDAYLAQRRCREIEAHVRRDALDALHGMVDGGVITVPFDDDITVRLANPTTLDLTSVIVNGSSRDDRVAQDVDRIRRLLSTVLESYNVSVKVKSQLGIVYGGFTK